MCQTRMPRHNTESQIGLFRSDQSTRTKSWPGFFAAADLSPLPMKHLPTARLDTIPLMRRQWPS